MFRKKVVPLNISRECSTCQYCKTMDCPNSKECYSTKNKPAYKPIVKTHTAKKFSNNIIVLSVSAICIFTTVYIIVLAAMQVEIPSYLVAAWFSFWGVEIVTLATITRKKIDREYEDTKSKREEKEEESSNG